MRRAATTTRGGIGGRSGGQVDGKAGGQVGDEGGEKLGDHYGSRLSDPVFRDAGDGARSGHRAAGKGRTGAGPRIDCSADGGLRPVDLPDTDGPIALAAVTPGPRSGPAPAPLVCVANGPVTIYGTRPVDLPEPENADPAATAAAHAAIVDLDRALLSLAAETTVLPIRFGAVFGSLGALVEALESEASVWSAVFERAAGAREYRVEIARADTTRAPDADPREDTGDGTGTAAGGKAFLARRRELRDRRRGAADAWNALETDLATALDPVSQAMAWRGGMPPGTATLALLVHPDRIAAVAAALAPFAAPPSGHAVSLTGPWPLYGFGTGGHGAD